jgi:hypothetical protein
MLCLICQRAEATIHVLDWPPDNPQVESHYCVACHERAYAGGSIGRVVEDDVPPPLLSRPRFTIRHLMIAAGLSGLLDAFLILLIRLCGHGTPAEINEWTMRAVLFGNVFCAVCIAMDRAFWWLVRWYVYATTGRWVTLDGLMPVPRPKGAGPPTSPRRESAGERFFGALIGLWCLLWALCMLWPVCGLGPYGLHVWIDSYIQRYPTEAAFTSLLILFVGALLISSGMVAAALRHRDRERAAAEPESPPVAGEDSRGSNS